VIKAAHVGVQRNAEDIGDGLGLGHFDALKDGGWCAHILGVMGEIAFAKWKGVQFVPSAFAVVDVAGYQVRTAMRKDAPLVIRKKDAHSDHLVLVTLWNPNTFHIVGGITAREGRKVGTAKDPHGYGVAVFVEQRLLSPVLDAVVGNQKNG
jgi:hypothetical protein